MGNKEFGAKLRELRYSRAFSLQKLADRLTGVRDASEQDLRGVNKSYISDLERGTKPPPSRKQIARFAQALRCSDQERDELYITAGFLPPGLACGLTLCELVSALEQIGAVAPPGKTEAPHYGTTTGGPLGPASADDAPVLPEHDFTVRIAGDVARGLYEEGDVLLVKAATEVPNGAPAVCKIGSEVVIRRYERQARTVMLTPADERYGRIAAGRVKVLGQVVGFIRAA